MTRSMLLSSWCGVDSFSVFGGILWHLFFCKGLLYCNWAGAKQFPVPASQWFIVAI